MSKGLRFAVVLASIAGLLLSGAGALAYAQSRSQLTSQTTCGSMASNMKSMGMMGGMNQYGGNQGQCGTQMGQGEMDQCQGLMASGTMTRNYLAMQTQNATHACY